MCEGLGGTAYLSKSSHPQGRCSHSGRPSAFVLSSNFLCMISALVGSRMKMILPGEVQIAAAFTRMLS